MTSQAASVQRNGGATGSLRERLGEIGLPEPLERLAAREWDVVIVGGGHNGLTTAAYLARAGLSVLVLERRERLGGACTLERPFEDQRYAVSPCAYVVGLLDQRIIDELSLARRGLRISPAEPNLWIPFEDGTSLGQWSDDARTSTDLAAMHVSAADQEGYWAYERFFDELRIKLRCGERDAWVGQAPDRAEIEDLLGHDQRAIDLVFEASISDVFDDFMGDQRLKAPLVTQGLIGTWGGPQTKGTAWIKLMHYAGTLQGESAVWGYVHGGMGVISFLIAEAAQEAGAVLACGTPVARVVPGEHVELEDGTVIRAKAIVCNADPAVGLRLLDGFEGVPADYRTRLEGWDLRSPSVKFNASLTRLPSFTAAGGAAWPAKGIVDVCGGVDEIEAGWQACQRGEPRVSFGEIYFQTGWDPDSAPEGRHLMSVFGQYAPYELDRGDWDSRRGEVERQFVELIGRFAPDIGECLEYTEVLGPPDIEARVGLTGGHIFQGQCRPEQMWTGRLAARTPIPGFYFCGAATHPVGSVVGLNGRNAAEAVLADLRPQG